MAWIQAGRAGLPLLHCWGKEEGLASMAMDGTTAISSPCLGSHSGRGDHSAEKHQGLCIGEHNPSDRPACKTHESQSQHWFWKGC